MPAEWVEVNHGFDCGLRIADCGLREDQPYLTPTKQRRLKSLRQVFKDGTKSPRVKSPQSAIRNPQSAIVVLFIVMLAASWQRWTQWISENYRLSAHFDSANSHNAKLGDKPFFILAYERNQ